MSRMSWYGWACRVRKTGRTVAALLCIAFLAPHCLLASQVRLIDLEQMTQRAARIFSGRCTGTSVVFDESMGRDVTVATFQVDRAVKGVTTDTVTVRMLSGAAADAPAGVPAFRAGDEVVLFLYRESAQGLSSPVGLGQGRFRVLKDKQGRKLALNDFGNRNLMTGLRPEVRDRLQARNEAAPRRPAAHPRDELDPAALLDAVETLVAEEN